MKTIRQIAEEIGIDKQRVYRYVKKHHINEAHQKNGVMYFNDTAEMRIKQHFSKISVSSEAHNEASPISLDDTVITILKNELEIKNQIIIEQQQTIKELTTTIKIQADNLKNKPQQKVYANKKRIVTKGKSVPIERLMGK